MFGSKRRQQEQEQAQAQRAADSRAADRASVRAAEKARSEAIIAAYAKVREARQEHAEAKRLHGLYADGPKKKQAAERMNRAADVLLAAEEAHNTALGRTR